MLIAWIGSPAEVDGTLPAVLVAACASQAARRLLLRDLAAAALGRAREGVVVAHAAGRPPLVARPAGSGLFLSSASRGGLAALAVAASPIGIDVECEDPGAAVPWNVLHADEIALLRALSPGERAAAFARIWSLKEAYLKAAGTGLAREPASFAVSFVDATRAAIADPEAVPALAAVETRWQRDARAAAAVSAVILAR